MAYKTLTAAMKDIFKSRVDDLKFFGKKSIYSITDMIVAEIKIGWSGSSSDYTHLVVTIQHKENGTIAQNSFIFEEYLERASTSHPNAKSVRKMYIWDDIVDFDWYIVYPVSTKPIVDAIFEYIEVYR